METMISHEIELDGVKLSVHGCYTEGSAGNFFLPSDPDEFEVEYIFICGKKIDIDITDLIYYRIQEIEEMIIEKYYR
jgi:hypothetical protein|tara:strand:- start:93 stop:323 length:231 start_codon:yes stop_codon:yes gene_type:complete